MARPGGVVMVSTWASERPLGLFGPMTEALQEAGMAEPYRMHSTRAVTPSEPLSFTGSSRACGIWSSRQWHSTLYGATPKMLPPR